MKSKQSISQKNFWSNSIFCNFKNGQESILELGKSLKLPKMQFLEERKIDLFDFTSFFAWTHSNFLARHARHYYVIWQYLQSGQKLHLSKFPLQHRKNSTVANWSRLHSSELEHVEVRLRS